MVEILVNKIGNVVRKWWKVEGKVELVVGILFFPVFFIFRDVLMAQILAILFLIGYTLIKMIVFKRELRLLLFVIAILGYMGYEKIIKYKKDQAITQFVKSK